MFETAEYLTRRTHETLNYICMRILLIHISTDMLPFQANNADSFWFKYHKTVALPEQNDFYTHPEKTLENYA